MTPDQFSQLPPAAQDRLKDEFLDAEGMDLVADLDGSRDRWEAWRGKWRAFIASKAAGTAGSEAA